MNRFIYSLLLLTLFAFQGEKSFAQCHIFELEVTAGTCANGQFMATLNFQYENVGNQGFKVLGNGIVYGTFSYNDLPITLGPLAGNGTTNYEFVVKDVANPDCQKSYVLGPVSCPGGACDIFDLTATAGDCDNGHFSVTLDFQYENVGNQGFKVFGNGAVYGPFNYGDLPVTLGPFAGNGTTNYEFLVKDVLSPTCNDAVVLGPVTCPGGGACNIYDLTATAGDCDNGQFMVTLDFQYANVGSQGFKVQGNGMVYGPFAYGDLPVTIGPFAGNGTTDYEFLVKDVAMPDCNDVVELGTVNCGGGGDCHIFDLTATAGDCEDGMFFVTLNFEHENTGNAGFKVQGNGINYGIFSYNDLPLTIGPLAGNGVTNYEFVVKDVAHPACSASTSIGTVECDPTGNCEISNLVAEPGACNADGTYPLTINFDVANAGNNFFKVKYQGVVIVQNAPISSLPYVIEHFNDNGNPAPVILVCINDMPGCCAEVEFDSPNCPGGGDCHIFNVIAEAHDCENGKFKVDIDFDYQNVGNQGFTIFGNGVNYGTFSYNQPFWTIGPLTGNGTIYEFVIKDLQKPDCKGFTHIGPIYCNGNCHIYDLEAEVSECNAEEQFYVTLNFEHTNTGNQGFKVFGNGNVYGFFNYNDLPITLGPFESGPNVLEFAVKDVQFPSCHDFVVVEAPDCDGGGGDCHIFDLVADVHPCLSNGTFYVSLDFEHENTSGYFKVKGNGIVYGVFSYDDLPVSIGPLAGNGTTPYGFIVQDIHHPDCAEDVFVGTVECNNSGDCNIFDLIADPGECHSDGTYNLWLNFQYENANNNYFDVYYNGDLVGLFPLAHLPVVIHHFEDDGEPMQSITVCINDNPNCCATVEYESPNCQMANQVWPGDANADNISNHFDLLNLGLAFGTEGPHRTVQGIEWLGLDATDWNKYFASDLNFKHADTDGNGKISMADVEALHVNFNAIHGEPSSPVLIAGTENDPPLFVDLPSSSAMIPGVPFNAPIILGSENKPVQNAYGIAFTLKFDPQIIAPGSVDIQYDPSWLGVTGVNLLTFDRSMGNEGIVKVALVRTDGNNVSGFGQIAGFIGIIDNIAGKENVSIEITDVRAIRENEVLISLYRPVEVVELITGTDEVADENAFVIYPNPAQEVIYFQHPQGFQVESVEVRDVNGRALMAGSLTNNRLTVRQLPSGVYTLKIKASEQFFFERFIKL